MGGSAECGLEMRTGVPHLPGLPSPLHAPLGGDGNRVASVSQLLGTHVQFSHT